MAQPHIPLFVDVQNRQLVRSSTSSVPAIMPTVFQGDTITLALRFLDTTVTPHQDIDYSAAAVTVAVGEIGAHPTAGTFTLTDTATNQTTSALAYNASAAQVQSAIQTALTTHWQAATVLGNHGGPYTITNSSNGVQTALIGTPVTLAPVSSVPITILQAGDTGLPAMQLVRLAQSPIALQNTWTASFSPDVLTGNLSLDTSAIEEVMGNFPCISPTLAIQVVPVGGEAFTVYQRNFTIQNDLIDGAPSIPTPGVSYYTKTESDARYTRQGIHVERDSTGNTAQHIVTTGAGANNILFLLTNANSTISFTFDNGTFDGQTITYTVASDINSITYSANVTGVLSPDYIGGGGATISFMWDALHSVWIPI